MCGSLTIVLKEKRRLGINSKVFRESQGSGKEGVKMRARGLLVAFLLAPGLCLVPSAGYGTISNELIEGKTLVRHGLLRARH